MQTALKISKWLHKYLGLILILFLMWMSLSGVLLNHPELIADFSVPRWLVPPQYHIDNWNRSALTKLIFSPQDANLAFASGKQGIWVTRDGGHSFAPMMKGLPSERYYRKTADIYLVEAEPSCLLAGTNRGLYVCDLNTEIWRRLRLEKDIEPARRILQVQDSLVVFTDSQAYISPAPPAELEFQRAVLQRSEQVHTVSLIDFFFALHDGSIWGLPGKLLFDAVGLILFFLSISAFYSWYYPWKRRRENKAAYRQRARPFRRLFKWFLKYHLKLGIWTAAILLIIGGTGLFMRPPLLVALVDGAVPAEWYPGPLPDNTWHEKIQNALYDHVEDRLVISAKDGVWQGPADFSAPFAQVELSTPIFVMGATVFEPYGDGGYLIGSFAGLFHRERATGKAVDMFTGREAPPASALRPADLMITGYFKTPQGERFITTHHQGLLPVGQASFDGRFAMPNEVTAGYRMPLWNFLFEIHNGRIFQDIVGDWYILIVPLGALLFILITLSGVFDWLCLKVFHTSIVANHVKHR